MDDDRTQKLSSSASNPDPRRLLSDHTATIVLEKGTAAGTEFPLEKVRTTLGRGPEVDIVVEDATMSRQHAAFDLGADGVRVQDLGSTNGVVLNGNPVESAELKHGDRLGIGEHEFRFLFEKKDREPPTWVVD